MMRKVISVAAFVAVMGCATMNTEADPQNKPAYQLIDREEQERRHQSCREDPYQQMCHPPGP